MPRKPARPCRYPGCPNFCESGAVYCPEHMKDNSVNLREKWRGSAASRGYDSRRGGGLTAAFAFLMLAKFVTDGAAPLW